MEGLCEGVTDGEQRGAIKCSPETAGAQEAEQIEMIDADFRALLKLLAVTVQRCVRERKGVGSGRVGEGRGERREGGGRGEQGGMKVGGGGQGRKEGAGREERGRWREAGGGEEGGGRSGEGRER